MSTTALDADLATLAASKQRWIAVSVADRIAMLHAVKDNLLGVAQAWAEAAACAKGLDPASPAAGEEWFAGPYAVMVWCNAMLHTLAHVAGKQHLRGLRLRDVPGGRIAARVMPGSIWDRVLFNGMTVDVWMQPGVDRATIAATGAAGYDPAIPRIGRVALVLGAGNVAAIAPLDCLDKLFVENQVVLLKMNPVNAYLAEFLKAALAPLIALGFLRIVEGDAAVGQYLCTHPLVETIHITGSGAAHDAIVWGADAEGAANKLAGTPKNLRPITSELGGVSPTIVVPGPWSAADLAYHAELVASQKLNNAGFNCIACQVLVLSAPWPQRDDFLQAVRAALARSTPRPLYYPGAATRLAEFQHGLGQDAKAPETTSQCPILPFHAGDNPIAEQYEVFAPALGTTELPDGDPATFLRAAIAYANENLAGTLGANILIHPKTMKQIGRGNFEALIADLRYGTIAINSWTGLGFGTPQASWGAFPGHTLADVQSGIGVVHNTYLFDRPERTVLETPFRAPMRPPWFIFHRRAQILGRLMTRFQYRPSLGQLPRIMWNAMRG